MKQIAALTIALLLALSLAACGGKDGPKPPGSSGSSGTPPASTQQEQQPSSTPDPGTEQTDSESTPPAEPTPSGDAMTVAEFLQTYGLSEDDCKPKHFASQGELQLQGKAGELMSIGIIDIFVDKDLTTEENIIDWYTGLYGKLEGLSDTGKLYADLQGAEELTSLEELIQGNPRWEALPAFSCHYPYELPAGRAMLMFDTGYNKEAGKYSVMILVAGFIQ